MKSVREYLDAFAKCGSLVHFESVIRCMLLNLEGAEIGLDNAELSDAAHTECYIYYKSSLILKNIHSFFHALTHPDEPRGDFVPLPTREINLVDECPAYLDIVEIYISVFGDEWYDPIEHRETFFKDIYWAFRWICNYLQVMSGKSFLDDKQAKRAFTFFSRDLRNVAGLDIGEDRAKAIPDLLDYFGQFRSILDAAIETLVPLEKALLESETNQLGGVRISKFTECLHRDVAYAKSHDAFLCSMPGDERPLHFPQDKRYEPIANRLWIWSVMPPSVLRFIEICKLIEQAALLAAKGCPDFNFSSRAFVHANLSNLDDHPKFKTARSTSEMQFTQDERNKMGNAFSGMARALLRLRAALRSRTGFGEEDIDEYDRFIAGLPNYLPNAEDSSLSELLFSGEEDELGGFNSQLLFDLADGARKIGYKRPFNIELEKNSRGVNAALVRAYKSGNAQAIDLAFEKIEKQYFKPSEPKKAKAANKEEDNPEPPHEIAMPGAKDSIKRRFSIAPGTSRIVDIQHNEAPYYLPAYEGLTQDKPIGYINRLIGNMGCNAHGSGDKYGGWVRLDEKWRMAFKEDVYKRFKNEQIQIGTKGNGHLGECRIIPDNLFKELTKAIIPTSK